MKSSSLYDVQKRAETGGAVPPQPPPTRASRPCLCTLIVLSLLIVLALAVALTLLLTGPDWLRLSYTGDSKLTPTITKTGSLLASGDKSHHHHHHHSIESPKNDEAKPETPQQNVTKASTTETPPLLVIPTPESRSPTKKFWFKEVIFFKPRPVKTISSETETSVTDKTEPSSDRSDKSSGEPSPVPTPVVEQNDVTKSASSGEETHVAKKTKKKEPFSIHSLFSGLWPFLTEIFPKTKTNQTSSHEHSEGAYGTTTRRFGLHARTAPAATPASEPTTRSSPEDVPTTAGPGTQQAGQNATKHLSLLRVRRVPTWIFASGNAGAFAHANSGASTSNGAGLGSGSYVRTYNRARNGVSRTWTTKDETRNGVRTHSSSDTGAVRLPEQRTSGGVHLVFDRATGTWRHAKLPAASAAYTPPVVHTGATWTRPSWATRPLPTPRSWAFTSPAATGAWGAFGNSQSPYSGSTSGDPFAAARRRMAAARRRLQQFHRQNMAGFNGFTNWG